MLFTEKTFADSLSFGVKFRRQAILVVDKSRLAIQRTTKIRKSLAKFRNLRIRANLKSNVSQDNLFFSKHFYYLSIQ